MSEGWLIAGSIVCILLVFLVLRRHKRVKRTRVTTDTVSESILAPKEPPPLPIRRAPGLPPASPNARALDYPKCPLDRSRNEPGKPQVVFWNRAHSCYVCCYGHRFTGRE